VYKRTNNHVVSGPPQSDCNSSDRSGCLVFSTGHTEGIERQGISKVLSWTDCQERCDNLTVLETNKHKPWWTSTWNGVWNQGDWTNVNGFDCTNATLFPRGCSVASACQFFSWYPDGVCKVTASTTYGPKNEFARRARIVLGDTQSGHVVTGPATCVDKNESDPATTGNTTLVDLNGNVIPLAGFGLTLSNARYSNSEAHMGGRFLWLGARYTAASSSSSNSSSDSNGAWVWNDGDEVGSIFSATAQADARCANGINTSSAVCPVVFVFFECFLCGVLCCLVRCLRSGCCVRTASWRARKVLPAQHSERTLVQSLHVTVHSQHLQQQQQQLQQQQRPRREQQHQRQRN
jgi:hypothetical protein